MKIRELTLNDRVAFKDLHNYSFYGNYWNNNSPRWNEYFEIVPWSKCLGCFDKEKLVSTLMVYNFPIFIRGKLMNLGGLTGIATRPEYRRLGIVESLLRESLLRIGRDHQLISALHPFKYMFYRNYGFEICTESHTIISQPEYIKIPKEFSPLKIEKLEKNDSYNILLPFRKKIGKKRNLMMLGSKKIGSFSSIKI